MDFERKEILSTIVVFIPLCLMFFSSLAYVLIYAKAGMMFRAVAAAFITWMSYSGIHNLMIGVPVDDRDLEKELPSSENQWVLLGFSSLLFIGGTGMAAVGLNSSINSLTVAGVSSVLTGYFIAHYEVGDHIV